MHYQQYFSGFDQELEQRTPAEAAYDNEIIKERGKGGSIKKALNIAAKKHPAETFQNTDENIDDIQTHYAFLLQHQLIKSKIAGLTN